jgi:hypothetical protein
LIWPAIAGCDLNPRAIRIEARRVGLYGCGNATVLSCSQYSLVYKNIFTNPATRKGIGTSQAYQAYQARSQQQKTLRITAHHVE